MSELEHQNQDDSAFVGVRVSVERGQRGGVGWKLSTACPLGTQTAVMAEAFQEAIAAIKLADTRMKSEFGQGEVT